MFRYDCGGRCASRPFPDRMDLLEVVVLTVTVVEAVVVELDRVTEEALQVAPAGRLEQVKLIVPENPFTAVTMTLIVPDAPGVAMVTVGLVDDT